MTRTPLPPDYYTGLALFEGEIFNPGGEWGNIGAEPVIGMIDLLEIIFEHFDAGEPPSLETLRVFHHTDAGIRDVTEDVIGWAIESDRNLAADGYARRWPDADDEADALAEASDNLRIMEGYRA